MTRVVVLAVTLVAAVAHADGEIVFARGDAVFQIGADGAGSPSKIADLPDAGADLRWMESTRDGRLVVLDYGPFVAWLVPRGDSVELRGGPCIGRARPSASGDRVICPGTAGLVITATSEARSEPVELPPNGRLDEAAFRGDSAEIAGLDGSGVVGFDVAHPLEQRRLAQRGAPTHLLIAPDGQHAVAMFGTGDASRVRSFLLDGDGVSRQLGGPGLPTLWSWDSTWVLFQEGDIKKFKGTDNDEGAMLEEHEPGPNPFLLGAPGRQPAPRHRPPPTPPKAPDGRACVGRATGGEVKCWDDFVGLAFSPDSTQVLLKRDNALYVGHIAGVHPDPPVKIVDNIDGAATWIPAPLGAPRR